MKSVSFVILAAFLTLLLTLGGPARADDPQVSREVEIYNQMEKFIERASQRERGMALTTFFGASDAWIAKQLLNNVDLQKRMQLSQESLASIERFMKWLNQNGHGSKGRFQPTAPKEFQEFAKLQPDELEVVNWDPVVEAAIASSLDASGRDQLDFLYLEQEGLSALARTHLANRLSLSDEQRNKILDRAKSAWKDEGNPLTQGLFCIGKQSPPGAYTYLTMTLRLSCMRMDQDIYLLLDAKQRDALATLVSEAAGWENYILTPEQKKAEEEKQPKVPPGREADSQTIVPLEFAASEMMLRKIPLFIVLFCLLWLLLPKVVLYSMLSCDWILEQTLGAWGAANGRFYRACFVVLSLIVVNAYFALLGWAARRGLRWASRYVWFISGESL